MTRRAAIPRGLAGAALLVLLAAAPARAADDFARANQDYAGQRYEEAISRYEALLADGVRHANLYYNLGNAYFRAGHLGRAILSFERALRLAPDAEDARYNLQVARAAVAARFGKDTVAGAEKDPLWIRVVTVLPLPTLLWSFLVLDGLFFAILVAVRFLSTGFLRTGLVVSNVFIGMAGALLGLLLAGHVYFVENVRMSVVVADEVVMREGPDPTRREMPKLHAGLRVILLGESQGWYRIRLSNQVEGWVPRDAVEEI